MRLAIFSDVHSNLPALEAVLADIEREGVDARYVLGDLVGYAPWPNEVLERLQAARIPVVMGNYDDGTGFDRDECGCAYIDPTEKALGDRSFAWTKAHTTPENKTWLRGSHPRSGSRPTGGATCSSTAARAGSMSTCTRTSPTRRSPGSRRPPTRTSSSAGTPTGRTTRPSAPPGSSMWVRPASRRTAIRAPAGR